MTDSELKLGKPTDYPASYAPDVLYGIARDDARGDLNLSGPLPFRGLDLWNAWDFSWLGPGGRPAVACCEIRVPASTPKLIESKSLKLYLNSFAMTEFDDASQVTGRVAADLTTCAGGDVAVNLVAATDAMPIASLPGECIDNLPFDRRHTAVDANLLRADAFTLVEEQLHTHLLRSLCPVTSQPDIGSLLVHYSGPKIDAASLLEYVVSFREHNDFHEACVERMFVDIKSRCRPDRLSVYARYQRRGGIDINPFRSDFDDAPDNARLWRQ